MKKALPISSFADNLHFKIVNTTGSGDGVGGTHRGRIFVIFAMTWCKKAKKECQHQKMQMEASFSSMHDNFNSPLPEEVLLPSKEWSKHVSL